MRVSNASENEFHYPNKMGRIILQATEEVLGPSSMASVLDLGRQLHLIENYPPNDLDLRFPFSDVSRMQDSLVKAYGQRGGYGLALRSGRACFKYGLREFAPLLGLDKLAFRLMPPNTKLRVGAGLFAETFNKFTDQRVRLQEQGESFLWHIDRCPVCWGRQAESPVCHLAVGILQEALYWVSGGRHYWVEETNCIAQGDPTCTIRIDKQPID